MENADVPAYPPNPRSSYSGLTKREHIAIELMRGLLVNPSEGWAVSGETVARAAKAARIGADELLKELEETKGATQ